MLREIPAAEMAVAWKLSAVSPLDRVRVEDGDEGAASQLPSAYFPTLRQFLGLPR